MNYNMREQISVGLQRLYFHFYLFIHPSERRSYKKMVDANQKLEELGYVKKLPLTVRIKTSDQ